MQTHPPLRKMRPKPMREPTIRDDYDDAWVGVFVNELLRRADLKVLLRARPAEIEELMDRIHRTLMTPRNLDFPALEVLFGDIKPAPPVDAVLEVLLVKDSPKLRNYNFRELVRSWSEAPKHDDLDPTQMARDEEEDADERWNTASAD
jgi:hypothetical protein